MALATTAASAQTYGFATLPAGTLSHVIASAISKAMKERAGLNVLVQPAAGGNVIVPLVGRGEAEVGLVNIMEAQDGLDGGLKDLRLIGAAQGLRTPFFVRKDSGMFKVADLKGKRVTMGFSAMREIDQVTRAVLASAGLTEADVQAGAGAQRRAQRRRLHGRQFRHVLLHVRRPEGARGRRHGRRHPRRWKWTRTACRRRARSIHGAI